MINVVGSAENDVIMDMIPICMGNDHIRILSGQEFIGQIFSNLVSGCCSDFSGTEGLDEMVCFVRAAFSCFGQCDSKLIGGGFR